MPRAAARLTSIPMRSMSSNGPIGKPCGADRGVDRLGGRRAGLDIASASSVNGRLTRLTMKPGVSLHRTGILPQAVTRATARSATAGSVAARATTSTSAITGAGLKKCRPSDAIGWTVARGDRRRRRARSCSSRGSPSARRRGSSARKIACLAARSSTAASMTGPEARQDRRGSMRPQTHQPALDPRRRWSRGRDRAGRPAAPAPSGSGPFRARSPPVGVVEPDRVAGLEGELCDPGTHRPGPDDADDARPARVTRPPSDRLDGFERLAAGPAVEDASGTGSARRRSP